MLKKIQAKDYWYSLTISAPAEGSRVHYYSWSGHCCSQQYDENNFSYIVDGCFQKVAVDFWQVIACHHSEPLFFILKKSCMTLMSISVSGEGMRMGEVGSGKYREN